MKTWISLLRSFFPKWIFFDNNATELRLEISFGKTSTELSEWSNALTPIRRSFKNLLINSEGNYLHACHNHLNHFNHDITALADEKTESLFEVTTYKITKNLAEFQIEQRQLITRPFYFKFRLLAVSPSPEKLEPHVILTSSIYESL